MDYRPKWKTWNHKTPRGKQVEHTYVNCNNIFLDLSPQAKETKAKINKRDLIKLKNLLQSKGKHWQNKRQPTEWEKMFANDKTDKGLTSKIYKQLIPLHIKKTSNLIEKWAEDLNRNFSKEDVQMANRHMKRYATSLIIREMQMKTTMRYYLTPVRMAVQKEQMLVRMWRKGNSNTLLVEM